MAVGLGRGKPTTVTVRTRTVLDPILEGVCLADEGAEFGRRVEVASLGWDLQLHRDAIRWQARATRYGAEMRRLARLVG